MKKPRGLFFYHDTEGIPPEIALRHLNVDGTTQFLMLCQYASDAIDAGWTKIKVESEFRDMFYLGLDIPEFFKPKKAII